MIAIKVGGSVLKDAGLIESLCHDLAKIKSAGIPLVLIHGGGPSINDELTLRGISWNFHQGLRVTTDEMMDVIEMVLCGKMNRKIVRTLNAAGTRAIGLSGADACLLQCHRADAFLGNVGEIDIVNTEILKMYLNATFSLIPVVAPVGIDSNGNALNVNADWTASKIAQALGADKLVYLTDQDGILDPQSRLLAELNSDDLGQLMKSGIVTGGMLAKVRTVVSALENGIPEVHIINARRPHSILEELFTDRGIGTLCKAELGAKSVEAREKLAC